MDLVGLGATIGPDLKLAFGSGAMARIELTEPDLICSVSAAMIRNVKLSLRNIENGRNGITDFIIVIPPCAADIS
jgi:hypothetical protein